MTPLALGFSGIFAMLFLIAVRIPVSFAISLVGLAGLYAVGGEVLLVSTLESLPYNFANQYGFVVIPMFILMGGFAEVSGITSDLYTFFHRMLGRVRGGLLMVTTLSSAGFAAISGSTMVNAVVFTRLALPQMIKFGYDRGIAAGCIAAAGTFAALIPPSIMMVIYALISGESIGALLIAGIVPGVLTAMAYLLAIAVFVRVKPAWAPAPTEVFTLKEKAESFQKIWPFALLATIIIGGIYSGLMFPSSAGAVGAAGAFAIALMRRRLQWHEIRGVLDATATTTAVLFLIIIAGLMLSRFFVYSGFVGEIVDAIKDLGLSPYLVFAIVIMMYLVLGCFMDTVSMTVVTVPFIHPIIVSLGFDPIWFGVILIKIIEIGVLTPPVGLNLFAVVSSAEGEITSSQMFRGIVPFLMVEALVLGVLIGFPEISLWLPEMMLR